MKTNFIHRDVVMKAFEEYMRAILCPEKLIEAEVKSFEKILIRTMMRKAKEGGPVALPKTRPGV